MGYFPALTEVPDQICGHLAQQLGVAEHTRLVDEVSRPATSHRYRTAVRTRLDSRPFFEGGREIVITTVRHCAQTMSGVCLEFPKNPTILGSSGYSR